MSINREEFRKDQHELLTKLEKSIDELSPITTTTTTPTVQLSTTSLSSASSESSLASSTSPQSSQQQQVVQIPLQKSPVQQQFTEEIDYNEIESEEV